MNFVVSTSTLLKQLQLINGVISSKAVIPILDYFLFQIEGNKLTITGTDLEVSMRGTVSIDSSAEFSVCVPAKLIIEVLKSLPEQPITFEVKEDTFAIQLQSENGKYKIAGESAEEFPRWPSMENTEEFEMAKEDLLEAIHHTFFATGQDELKPALTGILMDLRQDKIVFVATDGNRLAKYQKNDFDCQNERKMILSRKNINMLKNVLPAKEVGAVGITYNENHVGFMVDDIHIVGRLVDHKFPAYDTAIPAESKSHLVVNRTDMLHAIKRIAIFANKSNNQVYFDISDSELSLKAEDLDFYNEGFEKIPCEYDGGESMKVSFNAKFLVDMLSILDGDSVVLSLDANHMPGILKPIGLEEDKEILMLLMPILLKENND